MGKNLKNFPFLNKEFNDLEVLKNNFEKIRQFY